MADEQTQTTETPTTTQKTPVSEAVATLTGKHGSAELALAKLIEENHKLRDSRRELKTKVAPEGSVILQGEDASAWNTYRTLGKPSEIQAGLQERDSYKQTALKAERATSLAKGAEVSGLNPKALGELWGEEEVELVDTTVNGKVVQAAQVKKPDGTAVGLNEFVASKWPTLAASLKADSKVEPPRRPTAPGLRNGPPMPETNPVPTRKPNLF